MQYLALIYGEEGRWADLSPEEREREMGEYMALSQADVTKGGNELDASRPRRPSACAATRRSSPTGRSPS